MEPAATRAGDGRVQDAGRGRWHYRGRRNRGSPLDYSFLISIDTSPVIFIGRTRPDFQVILSSGLFLILSLDRFRGYCSRWPQLSRL